MSLGFTDSLALQRQTLHLQNGPTSPHSPNSPTARRSSHAVAGAGAYNNMGDPTRRMSRRMTMHAGWDRSRRQGSISHIATDDPNSLPNSPTYAPNHSPTYNRASYVPNHSPTYNRTSFDRNSMAPPRRHQRGSMMPPALGNVTEARDSIIKEDSVSPGEPSSPKAQVVETGDKDEATSTNTSGLPASPTSPGTPGSHRLKRTRQSQIIRQQSEANSGSSLGPLDEVDSPISPPSRKPVPPSMSATDAALLALEGNPTTPAFPPHDDIPQYLVDAQRRLSTLAPPPPPRAPRAVSPGQRAVRKLKTLSMGAIGRDTSPAPTGAAASEGPNALQSRFQEELPVPTASAKKPRSSSRERLGQATRKLKTMSVYVAGREVPPVLELQRSKENTPAVAAAAPDLAEKARSSPRPMPERSGSSNRVSRFLRTQSDLAKERYSPSPRGSERRAFLSREPSSAAAREHSRYTRASPKPSAKGQEVDFPDDASIASHHPVKPQHKMVYGVKETTADAKKGSRLKRFSMNVARLFQ